ncbi:MAG: DUF4318 domain-containing protein [Oscillospiraceae bacterium]|nr:DUF4318 domain-containing protein [Oscillospiraceae bacterium]
MNTQHSRTGLKFFFLECKTIKNKIPTAKDICETIRRYASGQGSEVVFLSIDTPVRFFLDGTVYIARKGGTPGGPLLFCHQEH